MRRSLRSAALLLSSTALLAGQSAISGAAEQAASAPDTAHLSGIVVDQSGRPVRLAIVTISGTGLAASRSRISDDEGRFVFEALPPGRFDLTAEKAAHITNSFGAKRPGRPGTLLTVEAGTVRTGVEIVLPRGGVITGTIRDTLGRPLPDAEVIVFPANGPAPVGGPGSYIARSVSTDDRGRYRIFGLEPGAYHVVAGQRMVGTGPLGVVSDGEIGPAVAWAPSYYPGTADRSHASPVSVVAGEVRESVDFPVVLVPAAVVEGVVTAPPGVTMESVSVAMTAAELQPRMGSAPLSALLGVPRPDANGRFRIAGLSPGRYLLTAQWRAPSGRGAPAAAAAGGAPDLLWAMRDLVVAGTDIADVMLNLQPGLSVAGRVEFEGAATPPPGFDASRLTVTSPLTAPPPGYGLGNRGLSAIVQPDGSFVFPGLMPGTYAVSGSSSIGPEWWLRSVTVDGTDVLDRDLTVTGHIRGLVATWSRRQTGLAGTLTTASGLPASDYFVVIFPEDPSLWRANARRVRATRPADSGRYEFERLPPGSYRVAALTDVEDGEWDDPSFLELLRPASLAVAIGDDEPTRFDIRLAIDETGNR